MSEDKQTIGERIRDLRKSLELSQEELEERVGLRPGTIAKIEAGTPPGHFLHIIADFFGVTPDDIRFGLDPVVQVAISLIPTPTLRQEFVDLAKAGVSRRSHSREASDREASARDLEVLARDFLARRQLEDEMDIFGIVE